MSKYYVSTKFNPILFNINKHKLSKIAVVKMLGTTKDTFDSWIENPFNMRLEHIVKLAGLFNMTAEELIYLLIRNKPQLTQKDRWYLESIKQGER